MIRILSPPSCRIILVVAAPLVVVAMLALLDGATTICWVGTAALEIEFTVTDADTGLAIKDALVEIYQSYEVPMDPEKKLMSLVTDFQGSVKYREQCMSHGTDSLFSGTYFVRIPSWWVRAIADNYETSARMELGCPVYQKQVRRMKGYSELTVPIQLRKKSRNR